MATLVRWEPFRELATLQSEMSRLMNSFAGGGNGESTRSWVPALDVWETENEIVYALDLPGIPEDDISIEFEDGSLTVTAERERKEEVSDDKLYRFERRFGTYSRTFGLPQGVTEGPGGARVSASPPRPGRAGRRAAPGRSRRSSRARAPRAAPAGVGAAP